MPVDRRKEGNVYDLPRECPNDEEPCGGWLEHGVCNGPHGNEPPLSLPASDPRTDPEVTGGYRG